MRTRLKPIGAGVYGIRCLANDKLYIGSSCDINRRWAEHKCQLRKNVHCNSHLQRSWNKYGESAFKFSVIELVASEALLLDREQSWIDELDTYSKGLNQSDLAGCGGSDNKAKLYIVTFPCGNEVTVKNLSKFCRTHDLNSGAMGAVCRGEVNQHKGFKVRLPTQTVIQWQQTLKRTKKFGHGWKGDYLVTRPDGSTLIISSITAFCRENKLSQGNMTEIANGRRKQHRGFRCSYLPPGENSTR